MYYNRKLITAPADVPVTLTEARAHLRIDDTAEDTLITTLTKTATEYVENRLNRKLITQTWEAYLNTFPPADAIVLPWAPLASITHLKYYDTNDTEQTYDSSNYYTDILAEPGRLVLKPTSSGWPSTYERPNAITVRYVCGYGSSSTYVPELIREAIKLLISHFFENREAVNVGQAIVADIPIPKAVDALLNQLSVRDQF